MPFKIVRNDITKMNTEAIVNTANSRPAVGPGCDWAVYEAAGFEELLHFRKEKIGSVPEGEVFLTPGFALPAKYIIHAVSPLYVDGKQGEEELLRSCYRKSLALAEAHGIRSIAFPLISTGGFGYPQEEGMRIAVDEIHAFLLHSDMQVVLVVFGGKAARMGKSLYPDLEAYIDENYVEEKEAVEYASYDVPHEASDLRENRRRRTQFFAPRPEVCAPGAASPKPREDQAKPKKELGKPRKARPELREELPESPEELPEPQEYQPKARKKFSADIECDSSVEEALFDLREGFLDEDGIEDLEENLSKRMRHLSDSFADYLLYLINRKGMENADVYKRAIVDKKVFSKIKNNRNYHPQKLTALCLCVGAKLTMDETKDLLARAGYALSPCDKTDIIFSYFIEHGIYDMIELDIQLEEHGLPCVIT